MMESNHPIDVRSVEPGSAGREDGAPERNRTSATKFRRLGAGSTGGGIVQWRRMGESNPRCRRERPISWATR